MKTINTKNLAIAAFRKHKLVCGSYDYYTGSLTMYAAAWLATQTGDSDLLDEVRSTLLPYVREDRKFFANFPNYLCGGNGAAWLLYQGYLPEAEEPVRRYADQMMQEAPRNPDGILCHPQIRGNHVIWIDVCYAVTFLLYAGLALNNDAYIEEAFQQIAKMIQAFHHEKKALLFQSRNMRGSGHKSEDNWSRGNGWGAIGLCNLAVCLPENHPHKSEAVSLYLNHVKACATVQNINGLWHQEMTDPKNSYVETSGSALMLFALGLGLEAGLVDPSERTRFERGLQGLLCYINEDTDIFHTCKGCLCPKQGTILDYRATPPVINDPHAFGPVVLAYTQAYAVGIETIQR